MLHKFKNAKLHGSTALFIDIKNEGLYEYWKMTEGLSDIENIENDNHNINIPIEIVKHSGTLDNESIDFEIIDLININNVDSNYDLDTVNKLLKRSSENIETQQSRNSSLLNPKDIQNQINNSNIIKVNEINNNFQKSNSELNKDHDLENIDLRGMVSSSFKRVLLWPEKISKGMKKKTEKIPTDATSDEWQAYHFKKEEEKAKKELEKLKIQEKRKAAQQKRLRNNQRRK